MPHTLLLVHKSVVFKTYLFFFCNGNSCKFLCKFLSAVKIFTDKKRMYIVEIYFTTKSYQKTISLFKKVFKSSPENSDQLKQRIIMKIRNIYKATLTEKVCKNLLWLALIRKTRFHNYTFTTFTWTFNFDFKCEFVNFA